MLYLRVERHYALNTQHAYQRDLEQLLSFINQQGVNSWIDLTGEHLNLLVMKMRHANSSGRTIRRHLSSIRGFLTYLVNQRYLSSNCALGLQPPRLDQNLPKILDYGQLTLMLNPRSKSPSELRDVAIIEVIYSCGLRVSELVGLDVNDMDAEQGFLSVMGKGGKMRHTPLGKSAQRAIANYLQKTGVTQGALFLNNRHVRISVRAIQTMVKKRALEVGIKINVHPHMLRHAAATHFLQSSHDLRSVQEFLGHESIKSTQVYTHLDFLELSKVYDQCHPRAKKTS
ncbi:MAG TPA: recombinase XerC [Gammaproteobacteria bacterium]|jgi:integrase/recombinase XerC|nr:recombinase XerC [Gammaproteobacteria bacterium]HAN33793.1 recombinase XerC [Gammaproteobacteria bacterium]HAO70427.1 recombinase XerC [Gammaproteobacteria bacterium]HAO87079.1 recombinase XerC [Gammaproteobacteria bacterium]HAQ68891.1 recombinase XerC [Gammaproteobacteria bacterium]